MDGELMLAGLGAIAGVGGFIVAIAVYFQNRELSDWSDSIQERLLGVEESRDREEANRRRSEQAELVYCWSPPVLVDETGVRLLNLPPRVHITNASSLPIYEVILRDDRTWETPEPLHSTFPTVPPGETVTEPWKLPSLKRPGLLTSGPHPIIEFVDARQVRWHRDGYGVLREGRWEVPTDMSHLKDRDETQT